jgi:hypothetical protein
MATRKRRIKQAPRWERGYLSHGLWLRRDRVGVVRLDRDTRPEVKYQWEAGTHTGRTATLKEAKRAVEEAVLLGTVQLPLFDLPQRD